MKLLNGSELAEFIKDRQAKQGRALRQAHGIEPRLAIVQTNPDPAVDSYMKLQQTYGTDILIDVEVYRVGQDKAVETIKNLNNDPNVHGIIVQIPLVDTSQTDEILKAVDPRKDVDGLGEHAVLDAATSLAIDWLLAGYNVDLRGKHIVIVGHGRLVGELLARRWQHSDLDVVVADSSAENLAGLTLQADILVCASGVAGLITKDMVKPNAVIVDAGEATDKNGRVGDVAADVRELPDITITPEKDGVAPLTVCALFDNVIRAARNSIEATE